MNPFYSIRAKLLTSFGIFILLNFVVILINFNLDQRIGQLDEVITTLNDIETGFQVVNRLEKDFFNDETRNPDFFETKNSVYLTDRSVRVTQIQDQLKTLRMQNGTGDLEIETNIVKLSIKLQYYNELFGSLVNLVADRGFKDSGVVGVMRSHIHEIEKRSPLLDLAKVLMIRRHEKDFIIRKQPQYTKKLNKAVTLLIKDVQLTVSDPVKKTELLSLLESYQDSFNRMVTLDRQIGLTESSGVRGSLSATARKMQKEIDQIDKKVRERTESVRATLSVISIAVMVISLLAGILIAIVITQTLSKPISTLSGSIRGVIENRFQEGVEIAKVQTRDEVGVLAQDFSLMLDRVRRSINEVQNKSAKIEKKQKLLLDSIRYAQKIQTAMLPDKDDLEQVFTNYFLVYEPLHVVSGDFYWTARKHDKLFFAVVDCTGHGVPGAFMSMIGTFLLNQIVLQEKIFDPAKILERLHQEVKDTLHQDKQSETDDGMEVTLCSMDIKQSEKDTVSIDFAGARSPLYYSSGEGTEFIRIKGTKRAIGGKHKSEKRPFETHTISVKRGEMLYLTSDGLVDQNNVQN
ncbi:MAG: SpoIIE family protein phosphatase [Bacteroidota bacterium]